MRYRIMLLATILLASSGLLFAHASPNPVTKTQGETTTSTEVTQSDPVVTEQPQVEQSATSGGVEVETSPEPFVPNISTETEVQAVVTEPQSEEISPETPSEPMPQSEPTLTPEPEPQCHYDGNSTVCITQSN